MKLDEIKFVKLLSPEDDQSILVETSVETNGSFENHPNSLEIVMVLTQTFPYRSSIMQSFKSYLSLLTNTNSNGTHHAAT